MKKDDLALFEILATKLVNNLTEARRDDKGKILLIYEGYRRESAKRHQTPEQLKAQIKMIRKVLMDISEDL